MMDPKLLVFLPLLAVGCQTASPPFALDGTWVGELAVTERAALIGRGSVDGPMSRTPLRLMLHVDPADDRRCSPHCIGGRVVTPPSGILAPAPPTWKLEGEVVSADSIKIYIGAGCDDCGTLWLTGRSNGDRIEGTWLQAFFTVGDRGTFTLSRRPS